MALFRFCFTLLFLLVSAASTQADSKTPIRIGYESDPISFDWQESYDITSMPLLNALMDGLTRYKDINGTMQIQPMLAQNYEPQENGKKWVFNLRKNIKWTDGKELVADDFVASWKRMLDPKFISQTLESVLTIKNAKKYQEGKLTDFSLVGVKARGKYRLEFELEEPMLYFPSILANPSMFPVRTDIIEKFGKRWIEPQNMQTLGAYKLSNYQPGKQIELKKNTKYWDNKPSVDTIQLLVVSENNTNRDLYKSGALDIAAILDHTSVIQDLKSPELLTVHTSVVAYYVLNQTKKPLDNPFLRKALIHAVDRNQIIKVLGGDRLAVKGWLPPGLSNYNPKIGLEFNPTLAKELLKKAGYTSASEVPPIDLSFNSNENHRKVAENFQYQVKANLGVTVNIKQVEWKVFIDDVIQNKPSIYRWGWVVDSPSAVPALDLMKSTSPSNYTKWKSQKYDDLLNKLRSETNKAKIKSLSDSLQKILVEDEAIVFPQYSGVSYFLVKPKVKNFTVDSMGVFDLKSLQWSN